MDHVRKHREIFCKFGFHQAAYIPTWTNWESVKHPRIGGGVVLLLSIFPAYAVLTEPYSPKIGATGVAWSLLGLIVEIAQNLQVVSTAPTSWPPLMLGITNAVGGLSSSLSGLGGFACIGHAGAVTMYSCQVLIFPAVIGTLAALAFVFRFHFAGVLVHFCNVAIQFDSEAVITQYSHRTTSPTHVIFTKCCYMMFAFRSYWSCHNKTHCVRLAWKHPCN